VLREVVRRAVGAGTGKRTSLLGLLHPHPLEVVNPSRAAACSHRPTRKRARARRSALDGVEVGRSRRVARLVAEDSCANVLRARFGVQQSGSGYITGFGRRVRSGDVDMVRDGSLLAHERVRHGVVVPRVKDRRAAPSRSSLGSGRPWRTATWHLSDLRTRHVALTRLHAVVGAGGRAGQDHRGARRSNLRLTSPDPRSCCPARTACTAPCGSRIEGTRYVGI